MFVRCSIDNEKYPRDYAIGKVKAVNEFSELVDVELSNENTTIDYNDNIKTIKFKSFTKSPQNRNQREKVVIQTERNPRNITLETEVNNTKFKLSNSNKTFDNNNNFPICTKLSVSSAIKEENKINLEEQKRQLIQSKMKIYESKLLLLFQYY